MNAKEEFAWFFIEGTLRNFEPNTDLAFISNLTQYLNMKRKRDRVMLALKRAISPHFFSYFLY